MTKLSKKVIDIFPIGVSADFETDSSINLRDNNVSNLQQIEDEVAAEAPVKVQEGSDNNGSSNSVEDIMESIAAEPLSYNESLEALLNEERDPIIELASMGMIVTKNKSLPLVADDRKSESKKENSDFYEKIISHIRTPISRAGIVEVSLASKTEPQSAGAIIAEETIYTYKDNKKPGLEYELGSAVADFYKKPETQKDKTLLIKVPQKPLIIQKRELNFHLNSNKKSFWKLWLFVLLACGTVAYGFTLKNEIVKDGNFALDNLQNARADLEELDFLGAASSFQKSYEDFNQASRNLNLIGAGIAGLFSDLPGLGKLKSAKDLSEAGKLLAQSGQTMSEAMAALSRTGSILNPSDKDKSKPLKIVLQIKNALILSEKNFTKAKGLLANIDEAVLPDDKKDSFKDFKDKLPLLEEYLGKAIEYTDFMEGIIGIDQAKKYLLLFNNYSELRPTGGFPGTYGVVSFASGGLSDFFVNDVYNLDGQLKRSVIPPKQLQHITPTWGMRDSSWFSDFPTSSKKAMSFFAEEAGYGVDGVIALNPAIVSGILKVVGPIEMPEYGLTLNADNFVESIQEEVEYGPNRVQPKKVVSDFAPRFLERLYSADSQKWTQIFDVLMVGLEEKDIMFYFDDKNLEDFSIKEGFGGEIKATVDDYLYVNFTNVKGSKTDIVTDSSVNVETRFEAGKAIHKVVITRDHKGGDHEHGFYNRQNPAYVRVLIPKDAELLNIVGTDVTNYKPLVNYSLQSGFERDRDLTVFESTFNHNKYWGIDEFEESGKKGLGFWMVVDPRTSKRVEFEYSVPLDEDSYSFYFQKQPGLDWKNFKFKLQKPENLEVAGASDFLNRAGDVYIFEDKLKKDLEINLKFR